MTISIRNVTVDDWREFRAIRLRMLADTPLAYGETLAEAESLADDAWRARIARRQGSDNVALVAVDDGKWVGIMRGYVDDDRGPTLVSVFVAPEARGHGAGVADALLDGIVAWARRHGDALVLDVHAENPRAIAFYRRRGFVETDTTHPYELPPYGDEVEMRLDLDDQP